ncbi:hypothetical protein PPYR_12999 [Photinus pyralis]|uniref:Transposase domain-containing protein n=1 Tax=Photinus pyralis TaxID=7054 RepID=A0A1Y1MYH5_PHOPY|nr:hypothetical protein PPYR_03728 [Photinus pyralis]KAB0793379.1 hypothetical protein PPYR_12999 [Photinus pyralis]
MDKITKNYKSFVSQRQLYRRIARDRNRINQILHSSDTVQPINITSLHEDRYENIFQSSESTFADFNSSISNIASAEAPEEAASDLVTDNSNNTSTYETKGICTTYGNSVTDFPVTSLSDRLRYWATSNGVTRTHVTSLLHILSDYHPELPLDARTLLRTHRQMTSRKLITGEYCHFGILNFFKTFFLKHLDLLSRHAKLSLSFNVDGIPLYHSSNLQLWPILAQIKNFKSHPFVVGVFCGTSKPSPLNNFLEDFINEYNSLSDGFTLYGIKCELIIHSFICDAPARAYLKQIKNHTGYSSCEKCTVYGEYHNGRVVLNSLTSPERTNDSFVRQIDEDHHIGISPLLSLPIGLVTEFPTDYMHNICLGVTRKLLNTWICGPLNVRFSSHITKTVSNNLESLKLYIPSEFNRKPRSLSELNRWKATEFRTFLLYLGPLVLRGITDRAIYENFLLLHTATTIMVCDAHIQKFNPQFCSKLLKTFVKHCEVLYGLQFIVYNVHLLSHIYNDVKRYGNLDTFSAFPFENFLGKLKRLVKSTVNPLKEIHNRILEMDLLSSTCFEQDNISLQFFYEHNLGPLLDNIDNNAIQFKKVYIKDFMLTCISYSVANCFCYIDNSVIQIHNILKCNNSLTIIGKEFLSIQSMYFYPIDSKHLKIFLVSDISNNLKMWCRTNSLVKCLLLPINSNNNVWMSMPIIHSVENNTIS